jgi:hypothetical protein
VIEPILLICINGVSIYEIKFEMQEILPVPYKILKKYFFILLAMDFYHIMVKDNSVTEDGGLDLLYKIHKEKQNTYAHYEDFTITIE